MSKRRRIDHNGFYLTRKDQIEAEDVPDCLRAKTPRTMRKALRNVALVAACGERDRTLEILKTRGLDDVAAEIVSASILDVLGWTDEPKRKRA